MSFARRALRSRQLFTSGFVTRSKQSTRYAWALVSRRGYASEGGHDEHKKGSDLPWAIGSIIVTVGGGGYLWSIGPSADNGHHADHGEHDEEHGSSEETHDSEEVEGDDKSDQAADDQEGEDHTEKKDSTSKDESEDSESKSDDKSKDKDEDDDKTASDSDSEDNGKETPDTSDDEKEAGGDGSEEVGGKPYSSLSPDKTQNQGAMGYKQKVGQTEGEGPKAASSAMHRARPHDDKSLSKKSEGYHDTARIQEPIDPKRPAR